MTESLMFDSNGASRFRSRSNQDCERQTVTAVKAIMPNFASAISISRFGSVFGDTTDRNSEPGNTLPDWLQTILDALRPKLMVDEELSDSECFHLLRIVGAQMDQFKHSHLENYFYTDEHLFEQTIWSPGDLSKYMENVVSFCASVESGYINITALTSILSILLKTELAQFNETINKTETRIIYSEKDQECGVIKLNFTGDQIKVKGCCNSYGASTKINVEKDLIMFKDSKELLLSLQTFAREYRQ